MRLCIDILDNLTVSIFTKSLLVIFSEAEDSPVSKNIYTFPTYSHFISREWER
jgi:hypothetical protein